MVYDEGRHRYFVGDRPVPGVTTICGVIGKGDGLTQWAVNQALGYLQERLFGNLTGEELEQIFKEAKYAHRRAKQEAASIGTLAHNWIEQHLKGGGEPFPEDERAANACQAALNWLAEHSYETIETERRIYSRRHHYAGTLDWLARVDGSVAVVDWKTSKQLYPDYRFQTAAYAHAYAEETGLEIEGRWLLRIDKENAEFEPIYMGGKQEQRKDFRAFKGALDIYKRQQELKT